MVKLAQTIGATGIAQSQRVPMNMGSHVIEVRQNLYSDEQVKNATRVFPFSDLAYSGAEVAAKSSVIASCYVPIVASVEVKDKNGTGYRALSPPFEGGRNKVLEQANSDTGYLSTGFGMADYLFGITRKESAKSLRGTATSGDFNERRSILYTEDREGTVDGSYPVEIKQYLTEDEALDDITGFPSKMRLGYVIGPRDVKLYYTETAIAMMARRMRNVVEALGPAKPQYYPIGLGHLSTGEKGKPWTPANKASQAKAASVWRPGMKWNAGAVQYKSKALSATGSFYIPWDQVPYGTMRRNFKYNHIMTQLGLEMMETLQAVGVDLKANLTGQKKGATIKNGSDDVKSGVEVSALQMLYAAMFGTTSSMSTTSDFTVDETSIAAGIKDDLGLLFNSGHIHIDPGVFTYQRGKMRGFFDSERPGYLSEAVDGLTYKGEDVSPAQIMREFIAKYVVWTVAKKCLEGYFTVPVYQCHLLYVGNPKPEYVTEQLQMNFRSDVYFDGDNSLPYTLIPTRLNPGEVISRVPCYWYLNAEKSTENTWLGVRDPLPYGNVIDIRFNGDKPMSTTEERDYTFTPIIEADASVQTQYRNSRTINCAVWPRPTHYSPGSTRIGAIYGLLSDNASVGGHYYYQPLRGTLVADNVKDKIYRAMKNSAASSQGLEAQYFKGMSPDDVKKQKQYWKDHQVLPDDNPQTVENEGTPEDDYGPDVFPTTVTGRKTD